MRYTTIKELKSPTKVNSILYLFDLVFILVYMIVAYWLGKLVYDMWVIPFYIYSFMCAFILTMKSPFNPGKRIFQSLWLFYGRSKDMYRPMYNPKSKEDIK